MMTVMVVGLGLGSERARARVGFNAARSGTLRGNGFGVVCIRRVTVTDVCDFFLFNLTAEANQRNQGLPSHRAPQGRQVCEDQEDGGCDQVQGALLQVLVHA